MKGCLYTVAALAAWAAIFVLNLSAVLVYVGADSLLWRWLALLAVATTAVLTLVAGRHRRFVQALNYLSSSAVSPSAVSASDEADYRRTTGVHSAAVVAASFMLLFAVGGALALIWS